MIANKQSASGAYSDAEIVKKLNAMGYRSKMKNRWDKGNKNIIGRVGGVELTVKQLQKVIRKTIYAGIKCEKWTRGLPVKARGFDGIVSIDTFNRANRGKVSIDYKSDTDIRILYDNGAEKIMKKRMKNNPLFPYKFIRCPICGKPFTGSVARIHTRNGGFPSYHCSRGHAYFGVNKKTLDGNVEYYIKNLKFESAYLSGLETTFMNKYREREKEIVNLSAEMSLSVSDLKAQQAAKIEAFVATTNPVIRKALDEEVTKLDVQIKKAEAERAKIEITESDIKAFIGEAKKVMGQPSEMLLNPTTMGNPRAQQALFGLVFEEIPNYEEIVNGTARLTWIFKLSSEFAGSKGRVGCLAEGRQNLLDGRFKPLNRRLLTRPSVGLRMLYLDYQSVPLRFLCFRCTLERTKMEQISKKEVRNFQSLFPSEVTIAVRRSEDGGFAAEILSYPRTFTEADTFSELIEMVNDALYTYFDVPEKYVSFMPTYLPPLDSSVKDLVGFPVHRESEKITLELAR